MEEPYFSKETVKLLFLSQSSQATKPARLEEQYTPQASQALQ